MAGQHTIETLRHAMRAEAPAGRSAHPGWLFVAIGIGTFVTALDTSMIGTILPLVGRSFGQQISGIEWVLTIYLLVVSSLLLSAGRLGDLGGYRRAYVLGFAVYGLGSIFCGLSPTLGALIGSRGLQAIGAALIYANSPAILTHHFPPARRGRVLGLQATMTYLGLTLGPSLGGWLADHVSWRSVFVLSLPLSMVGIGLGLHFIPPDVLSARTERFDLVGAVTFSAGLVALLLGLNRGHAWGWFSWGIGGLLALAGLLLMVFVALEMRISSPMLDLRLFSRRLFSMSVFSALFNYIPVSSLMFLLPFYFIQGRGLPSAQTGLLLTTQPLVMAIAAPASGALSDRIGSRLLSTVGIAILASAIWLLSRIGPQTSLIEVAWRLALVGLGTGIFISPNTSALMGAAPRERQGIAGGVMAMSRNLGQVLGVGLAGAISSTIMTPGRGGDVFDAVGISLSVVAGVAALGVLTSALRGR